MIDHLVSVRLGHWDDSIRYLAACALGSLCSFDSNYMMESGKCCFEECLEYFI
ncbi:unnamed protein product [Trichobilharzia regenti]|nr:unnamed protein product [Trichobilharzia regenti]